MEIAFDRDTLSVLKYIYRSGDNGVSWRCLTEEFDHADFLLLECLSKTEYTVTKDQNGQWLHPNGDWTYTDGAFRSYCSPKGNELIQRRCYDFWKWTVPVFISIAALIVSIVGAIAR